MLHANTKNPGVLEAIKEVRIMNLGKTMRALYEGHMKQMPGMNMSGQRA